MPIDLMRQWRTMRSYLVELVVIIAGILLALAADAAWDYRQDREEEAAILRALVIEFKNDAAELIEDQAIREERLDLYDALINRADGLSISEKAQALKRLMGRRFYAPNHAVLDDVLTTGRLGLLTSDRLRLLIMSFEHERETQIIMEGASVDIFEQFRSLIIGNLDLLSLNEGKVGEVRYLQALGEVGMEAILKDSTFRSLMYLTHRRLLGIHQHGEVLLGIVRDVEAELAGQIAPMST
jgi:hypothetical protein